MKSSGKEAYRDELRCLRLLAAARHPCILELYGSYTYRMKHNFLFREAVQGDLHDLLAAEQRPPAFAEDESFYLAFCGLASALEKVHCFANDDLKLKMIGCHHDLKPHNVLVDNGRFILADFGLATMKDPSEGTLVEAKDRDLYFLAPENIDFVQNVRGRVGPSTDIWSLGCMLLDVFTFMRGGRRAVQDFRDSRSYQDIVGGVRMGIKAYHDFRGGLNPATTRHLNKMEADFLAEAGVQSNSQRRHIPEVGIIKLVWEMLTIDPLTRPDIKGSCSGCAASRCKRNPSPSARRYWLHGMPTTSSSSSRSRSFTSGSTAWERPARRATCTCPAIRPLKRPAGP